MNPAPPLVSVVLPTFNRAELLKRSAGSVLEQDFADLELIVVDDASTEDVEAATRALNDPRVRYVRRAANGGVAAARNSGVHAARGRYLAFQDSDDEWLPGKLKRQLMLIEKDPAARMVICGLLRVKDGRRRKYPRTSAVALTRAEVLHQPFAYTQTWLVPRDVLVGVGGFDETLRVWDDWELLIRLSGKLDIRVVPDLLVRSIFNEDGISGQPERFIHDVERIIERHGGSLLAQPGALAHLHYIQGRLLGRAGRGGPARSAFLRAVRLDPSHWRASALLAAGVLGRDWGLRRLLELAERAS